MVTQSQAITNQDQEFSFDAAKSTIVAEPENQSARLAELAEDTKRRLKRTVEDIYYVGLNLLEAKEMLGHGKFIDWIDKELGIDRRSAYRFTSVTEMLQSKWDIMSHLKNSEQIKSDIMSHLKTSDESKNGNFPLLATQDFLNLAIAPTVLYELAAPSTPEQARDEVLSRAAEGENISVKDAKQIIKAHKKALKPEPTEPTREPDLPTEVQLTIPKPQTYTLEEVEQIREDFRRDLEQIEKDWELKLQSQRTKAPMELELEYEELQASYQKLLIENSKLKQEIFSLQELRKLEEENDRLQYRIKELEHAVSEIPGQRWHGALNEQATIVLNKQVASIIDKFPPELHLRSLATSLPEPQVMAEVLSLIGQTIQNLVPIGAMKFREALSRATRWEDFEPITLEWIDLKPNVWTQLTLEERIKIKQLVEASQKDAEGKQDAPLEGRVLKIGDRVRRLGGDPYDVEYELCGEIIDLIGIDFRVLWMKSDGKTFEKRQSMDELELITAIAVNVTTAIASSTPRANAN